MWFIYMYEKNCQHTHWVKFMVEYLKCWQVGKLLKKGRGSPTHTGTHIHSYHTHTHTHTHARREVFTPVALVVISAHIWHRKPKLYPQLNWGGARVCASACLSAPLYCCNRPFATGKVGRVQRIQCWLLPIFQVMCKQRSIYIYIYISSWVST